MELPPAESLAPRVAHDLDNVRAAAAIERLGNPQGQMIALAVDAAVTRTYAYWSHRGAVTIPGPAIIESISSPIGAGSDSVPVEVLLNGEPGFLTDSSQFTLELAARVLQRTTYYVMHSFRGEVSDATHLAEFIHAEAELLGDLDDVISSAEDYLRSLVAAIHDVLVPAVPKRPLYTADILTGSGRWPRLSYVDGIEILKDNPAYVRRIGGWWMPTRAGELHLASMSSGPMWLLGYPAACVPFYQAAAQDRDFARCADLLVPGIGEVLGAGERHATSSALLKSIKQHGVDPSPYRWYIALRDSYPATTGGFGLGLERFIAWLLQLHDIGMVPVFPRRNR
jgi:asparaginyl-tRNA synthetase